MVGLLVTERTWTSKQFGPQNRSPWKVRSMSQHHGADSKQRGKRCCELQDVISASLTTAPPSPGNGGPFLKIRNSNSSDTVLTPKVVAASPLDVLVLKGVVAVTVGPQQVFLWAHTCHGEPGGEISYRRAPLKHSSFCGFANSQVQGDERREEGRCDSWAQLTLCLSPVNGQYKSWWRCQ